MTLQQGLAFGLIVLTITAFVWGRFRYDLVAVVALVLGLAVGIIPARAAFDGFKNDVTIIIACALIVSAAKVCVNGAARFIGEQAIQLHGGIGMTEELSVGHYFKRLLTVGSLFGDSDHHLDRIAGWGA